MNLNLNIEDISEIVTICGANNSGKTNILRALEIFFKPYKYNPEYDAPNHKFNGSRGQTVYPEITLLFSDNTKTYEVKRIFDINGVKTTTGKLDDVLLSLEKIDQFVNKFSFFTYLQLI